MTYFMAYVILASAGIAACAVALDLALRAKAAAARWVWAGALGAIVVMTGLVTFAPSPVEEEVVVPSRSSIESASPSPVSAAPVRSSRAVAMLRIADGFLPLAWMVSSALLLAAILYGQRRLTVERAASKRAKVNGRDVLLTENVGPAVAGVGRPVVLLPRWVLALDAPSQELLLAHEFEHLKRGDTRLLFAGAVGAALMPWNPVVWWVARRLRLAVEQDCDARVLRTHPDVRRYADLLLMAASRPRVSTRLLAAHFGEHRSDLGRRIQAMTDRKPNWHRTLVTAAIAGTLVAVSCEAPRPEPVAPLSPAREEPAASEAVYEEIVKPVLVSGSRMPKYPEILKQAGVEGEVLVSFDVDETGQPDAATVKVIQSTHELFSVAVRQALPGMRFRPAERNGRKVKLTVQEPFTFTLAGTKSPQERRMLTKGALQETEVTGARGRARLLLRDATSRSVSGSPLIIVDGIIRQGDLNDIDTETIKSIEVVKGPAASKIYGPRAEHGVIQIVTKARRRVP